MGPALRKTKAVWNDIKSNGPSRYVRLIQIYYDKIDTAMKQRFSVLYTVHEVLLNFMVDFKVI